MDTLILGGGCFWCLEAVFQRVIGVTQVQSGYSGGHIKNPAYREVCNGTTGHAEVVEIKFDEAKVSLESLLQIFFTIHDPTTLNRQGADVGTQYRSAIYHQNKNQEKVALNVIQNFAAQLWDNPIVTELAPLEHFYPAEENHHNYFTTHQSQPYCRIVINPKVTKLKTKFSHLFKEFN